MIDASKTIEVTNPRSEDFIHTWDSVPFCIPAKSSMIFPVALGVHMAKHLADVILRKDENKNPDIGMISKKAESIMHEIQSAAVAKRETEQERIQREVNSLNQKTELNEGTPFAGLNDPEPPKEPNDPQSNKFCDFCNSRGVRHKKECTKPKE